MWGKNSMHSDTNLKCTLQIWVNFDNPVQHITSYNIWNVVYSCYCKQTRFWVRFQPDKLNYSIVNRTFAFVLEWKNAVLHTCFIRWNPHLQEKFRGYMVHLMKCSESNAWEKGMSYVNWQNKVAESQPQSLENTVVKMYTLLVLITFRYWKKSFQLDSNLLAVHMR